MPDEMKRAIGAASSGGRRSSGEGPMSGRVVRSTRPLTGRARAAESCRPVEQVEEDRAGEAEESPR